MSSTAVINIKKPFETNDKVMYLVKDGQLKYGGIFTVRDCFFVRDNLGPNNYYALVVEEAEGNYNAAKFEIVENENVVEGSASKNDKEKIDLSLIPYVALKAEAQAFMVGEKKYNRYNYTKGHKASQLIAAAIRHLMAYNEGEENDPVDGQPHLGSVRACCAMLLRQAELGTLKDDRFKKNNSPTGGELP